MRRIANCRPSGALPLSLGALLIGSALAVPASAADRRLEDETARVADIANDPAVQDGLARSIAAMLDAVMSMKVGPLGRAVADIDPDSRMADIDPDATLDDLAAEDDPYYADRIDDRMRSSARAMGAMASVLAAMAPSLADAADRMDDAMRTARDRLPRD